MAEKRTDGPERQVPEEARLEAAFALARAQSARPAPAALLARIEADAAALLPEAPGSVAEPTRLLRAARTVLAALGGWPAVGGLATAGIAGFWLGFSPPAVVEAYGGWPGLDAADTSVAAVLPDDYLADLGEG